MSKVIAYTDASRFGDGADAVSAYGFIAMDENAENSFVVPFVEKMTKNVHSTVHAEVMGVLAAAEAYGNAEELHIFTDSLFVVQQWTRERTGVVRRSQVFREEIAELAKMDNIFLHHVSAHKGLFYNEVVDKMVRFVADEQMTPEESQDWARQTCRDGVLEIFLTKDRSYRPKYIRRSNPKNSEFHSLRMAAQL